jgi:hypothetical protein
MCKQAFPLKSTHVHQECEAELLEPTVTIPPDCKRKVIAINEVWLIGGYIGVTWGGRQGGKCPPPNIYST